MAYLPQSDPDPRLLSRSENTHQLRNDAWNRVAELASRLGAHDAQDPGALEVDLAGTIAYLRGLEKFWVYPGRNAVAELEALAVAGHLEELADRSRTIAWRLGRFGDRAITHQWQGRGSGESAVEGRHYFTVLVVSQASSDVLESTIAELRSFRRPDDDLIYEVLTVDSFDAALACAILNNEVQAVIMRPDIPLRSGAAFGMFDTLMDRYEAEFSLSTNSLNARSHALATVMHHARPHLDLYLLADEALPDNHDSAALMDFDRAFYRYESRSELHMTLLDGVRKRLATPFFDALKRYADKPIGNFHALPIARGNSVFDSPWMTDMVRFYGRNIFLAETSTTSGGLDSLLAPTGSIKQAQVKAAKTFGADKTYFVTNGTSTSNKIVVQALTRPGNVVLIDRNCHKSHHYGLILAGAQPVYLDAYKLPEHAMYGAVPLRTIKERLLELKRAGRLDEVRMLLLTNCTFDGITYDPFKVMLEVLAIKPDMIFLWDEAWFAFAVAALFTRNRTAMAGAAALKELFARPAYREQFAKHRAEFDELDPEDDATWLDRELLPDPDLAAVRVYATQSTHKSLSALRQASMIHVHDENFARDVEAQFQEAFLTHTSTSPNYQVLASLDLARRQVDLEGYGLVSRAYEIALVLRRRVATDPMLSRYFEILDPEDLIPAQYRTSGLARFNGDIPDEGLAPEMQAAWKSDEFVLEPTRATLRIAATGVNGDTFKNKILMDQFGLQVNKTSINSVLFIVTIGANWGSLNYLIEALTLIALDLDKQRDEASPAQAKVLQRRIAALTSDLPHLPDFSRFHDRFKPFAASPEGDMRAAFYMAYNPDNIEYLTLDEAFEATRDGRELVSTTMVVPYPPGFPVLVPGQVVSTDILEFLGSLDVNEIHGYHPDLGLEVFTEAALSAPEA